ncbi:AAR030Wp [Eremothecium gossypii ATCC 10895]|uniref:Copper transport protein n=1 Tax=Eremothecium gossypii (strain ATCC 10895 / CBS 109.51 / FGSC 9923 / NRRL Y-1056) TaxID=284811 RepID=Q75EP9_EREGS|nr:AAR030Wp [Eremothecium gossypii ATCC 10895]AAS50395.1 AAR030Wp [Eremothecium gossypii ATCC 10895]AEY94681.1 FAAR030Wp [Eremothecium gossypii FDAG1]
MGLESYLGHAMLKHHDADSMPTMTAADATSATEHAGHGSGSSGSGGHGGSGSVHMMNMYLGNNYKGYPVLFKNLKADNGAEAFGIFVLIVVACFAYKSLLFISWCLEVKWFKNVGKSQPSADGSVGQGKESASAPADIYARDIEHQNPLFPTMPHFLFDIFAPTWKELLQDLVRLVITFLSTLIVYLLMLVAMSYVLTFIFAIAFGLATAEVFYNRCKLVLVRRWDLKRELEKRKGCPGSGNCSCGYHRPEENAVLDDTVSCSTMKDRSVSQADADCCCAPVAAMEKQQRQQREVSQIARQREENGDMNVDLMPAEKFK